MPTLSARCFQDDNRAKLFAEREMGVHFSEPYIGLVVVEGEKIVGAVILNVYIVGDNLDVTAVGHVWSVKVIREIMRYCFARVRRLTAKTSVTNAPAIKALQAMGFKQEGVMREYFPHGDALIFGLLRSEQKIVRL